MKKKTKKRVAIGVVALLLAGAVTVVGVGSEGFKNWNLHTWFQKEQTEQTDPPAENPSEENDKELGGAVLGESVGEGVAILSAKIPVSAYAANGISELAESAYMLTATITPENATDQALTWSRDFEDPASEWAQGKNVEDYLAIMTNEKTATLSCLQAFGEPIVITVRSQENESLSATCRFDYRQRVSFSSIMVNDYDVSEGHSGPFRLKLDEDTYISSIRLSDSGGVGGSISKNINKSSVYTIQSNYTAELLIDNEDGTGLKVGNSIFLPAGSDGIGNMFDKEIYFDLRLFDNYFGGIYFSGNPGGGSPKLFSELFRADPIMWEPKDAVGKPFMKLKAILKDDYSSVTHSITLVMSKYIIPVGSVEVGDSNVVI